MPFLLVIPAIFLYVLWFFVHLGVQGGLPVHPCVHYLYHTPTDKIEQKSAPVKVLHALTDAIIQ